MLTGLILLCVMYFDEMDQVESTLQSVPALQLCEMFWDMSKLVISAVTVTGTLFLFLSTLQ